MVKYYINKYSGIKNSVLFRLKNEELQMFTEFKGWIKHAPEKHPSSLDLEEVNLSIYLNNANDIHMILQLKSTSKLIFMQIYYPMT
jgi:NADH:ubiquinone oxidoreductase subunit